MALAEHLAVILAPHLPKGMKTLVEGGSLWVINQADADVVSSADVADFVASMRDVQDVIQLMSSLISGIQDDVTIYLAERWPDALHRLPRASIIGDILTLSYTSPEGSVYQLGAIDLRESELAKLVPRPS